MRYGKICETVWNDRSFRKLSETSKLLYVYLLSCSRCTNIGLFQLGLGTMEDEFDADRETIRTAFRQLEDNGLAFYEDGWVWFNKYLKWNAPMSPNHVKQIAAMINEVVMQDAPVDAVASLLHSAKSVMYSAKQSGKEESYYSVFRKALNTQLLAEFVGGEDNLESCFNKGLVSTTQGLGKGLARATEGLSKGWSPETETETDQKQNRTEAEQNSSATILVIGNDGLPHEAGKAVTELITHNHPEWDMHIFNIRLQTLTDMDKSYRPQKGKVDEFVLEMASYFDGETLQKPQKPFSLEKHEITPLDEKSVPSELYEQLRGDGESHAEENA